MRRSSPKAKPFFSIAMAMVVQPLSLAAPAAAPPLSLASRQLHCGHRFLKLYTGGGRGFHGHRLQVPHLHHKGFRALMDSGKVNANINQEDSDFLPPGCTRIKVELNKPLGIVLEEDKAGNIFVAEVLEEGNADKSGLVDVGDQLIATSAIVYGNEEYYQGVKVRKGMQIVRLGVCGERFETVMAAIGTHPAYVKVTLEIQKCKPSTASGVNNGAATS